MHHIGYRKTTLKDQFTAKIKSDPAWFVQEKRKLAQEAASAERNTEQEKVEEQRLEDKYVTRKQSNVKEKLANAPQLCSLFCCF